MKSLIISFLLLATFNTSAYAFGDSDFYELREWSHSASDSKLKGRMIDRSVDGKKMKLYTEDNKFFWVDKTTFTKEDQEYIEKWVNKNDHLTVKVTKYKNVSSSGSARKTYLVTAKAGNRALKVHIRSHVNKTLKPGQTETFTVRVKELYATASIDGKIIQTKTSAGGRK